MMNDMLSFVEVTEVLKKLNGISEVIEEVLETLHECSSDIRNYLDINHGKQETDWDDQNIHYITSSRPDDFRTEIR